MRGHCDQSIYCVNQRLAAAWRVRCAAFVALAVAATLMTAAAGGTAVAAAKKAEAKPVDAKPEAPGVSGDARTPVPGGSAPKDDMSLEAGAQGTVFRTLTIEGEDRIHLEIQRPALRLDLDPASAPGLELGSAEDVMNRTRPDLQKALLDAVPAEPSERLGRPWLDAFASGPVARFQPDLTDVETWSLTVTDARGREAARFEGRGRPPKTIEWDGRGEGAAAAMPGLTYSYVLEARDRAGNRRHFVGEGFEVPAYRVMDQEELVLTFPGDALAGTAHATSAGPAADPLLADAASRVNQMPAGAKVEIHVTARSRARAEALARQVHEGMRAFLVGDPARVMERIAVEADAPAQGTVRIRAGR